MRRYLIQVLVFVLCETAVATFTDNLRIISFSNIHSNLNSSPYIPKNNFIAPSSGSVRGDDSQPNKINNLKDDDRLGGLRNTFYHLRKLRRESPHSTLTFDIGGTIIPINNYSEDKMDDLRSIHFDLNVDNISIGNELRYGREYISMMNDTYSSIGVEILSMNIVDMDEERLFNSYAEYGIGEYSIAVLGISNKSMSADSEIKTDYTIDEIDNMVHSIKNSGADLIIVLSSNTLADNVEIARSVSGINILIGGSDSMLLDYPLKVKNEDGYTLVITTGENGEFLSVLDLDMDGSGFNKYKYRVVPTLDSSILQEKHHTSIFINDDLFKDDNLIQAKNTWGTGILKMGMLDQVLLAAIGVNGKYDLIMGEPPQGTQTVLKEGYITTDTINKYFNTKNNKLIEVSLTGLEIENILNKYYKDINGVADKGYKSIRSSGISYQINNNNGNEVTIKKIKGQPYSPAKSYNVAMWGNIAPEKGSYKDIVELISNSLPKLKLPKPSKDKILLTD